MKLKLKQMWRKLKLNKKMVTKSNAPLDEDLNFLIKKNRMYHKHRSQRQKEEIREMLDEYFVIEETLNGLSPLQRQRYMSSIIAYESRQVVPFYAGGKA